MPWKIALKCPDLQIRVQVNADEDLLQNIYTHPGMFLRLATLTGSTFRTYPSIMNSREDSFTIHKSQNLHVNRLMICEQGHVQLASPAAF